MTQGEAYEWLKERTLAFYGNTGELRGATKDLFTKLSADLARLVDRQEKSLPDPYGWFERIDNYEQETGFPGSLFVAADGRLVGTWILGNDYRVKSAYYGGYPNTYLPRVRALFHDKTRVLHLFSGMVDTDAFPGDTVDLNADLLPDYIDDAQTLENVPLEEYDPPYSVEDAEHYQIGMVKRNKVLKALSRLPAGAYVVWLDQVLPMWRKDIFRLIGVVGIVRSTNHRFRVMNVYERL